MEEFYNTMTPQNANKFDTILTEHYLYFARMQVTEFLLQNVDKNYYDFTGFFQKHNIENNDIKKQIKDTIVNELKQLNWHLAYIFDETAIAIYTSDTELSKSVWASSFDFKKI